MTLADLAKMTPFEQMMASLAITGEDAQIAETFQQQELPQMRPMQDQWAGVTLGQMMGGGAP